MPKAEVQLIIQGDDFGMCHAVNEGVAAAFVDGVLTQSSVMAPCPWVDEALSLARRHHVPVGLHQTLTCDWENLRWRAITGGRSLAGDDGLLRSTVADTATHVGADEATEELLSQAERVVQGGCRLDYLDVHMGMVCLPAYQTVSGRLGVPFLYPGLPTSLSFTSIKGLSQRKADDKKPWLLAWLDRLAPGVHLLVCHPGVPGPELASLTSPGSPVYRWAEEYRASDLATLTDPDVRWAIEARGIRLTSVGAADFTSV